VVDAFGSFRTALGGTLVLVTTIALGFVVFPPALAPLPLFMLFMLAMGLRNVSYNTLCSRVPDPHERARFMSIQSAVQHLASATGAFLSARLLTERSDHSLVGMDLVARISIGLSLMVPLLMFLVERRVRARERDRGRPATPVPDAPPVVEAG
jgi:predicted MFS family arabinose efflux permease